MNDNFKKNYILFLLLSTVVIIGYSFIVSKETKTKQNQVKEKQILTNVITKNDIISKKLNEEIAVSRNKYKSEIIKIESDLYRAEIDTLGAKIVKWDLKKYKQTVKQESPYIKVVDEKKKSFTTIIDIKGKDVPLLLPYEYEGSKNLVVESEEVTIDLTWSNNSGIHINKTLTFYPNKYFVEQHLNIVNDSKERIEEKILVNWSNKVSETGNSITDYSFISLVDDELEKVKKSVKEPKKLTGKISWFGFSDKYFLNTFLPNLGEDLDIDIESRNDKGLVNVNFSYPDEYIYPGNNKELKWKAFLGPKDSSILNKAGSGLEQSIDYGYVGGLTKIALKVLKLTNNYINNYGITIIVITLFLRLIFLPLTVKSMKSMKEVQFKMQALKPQIDAVKEKYKDDRQTQQTEMMKLYSSNGINPLSSLGGCLPLLLQFPIFIALYFALLYSLDLRHSSFLWIHDLSEPEHLFDIAGIPFRIMPLLMGISWFISQKLTPTTAPGSETMELQMKMMQFLPIIFTVMFWGLPSGLILYWTVSNILSIGQQLYINYQTQTIR